MTDDMAVLGQQETKGNRQPMSASPLQADRLSENAGIVD